METLSDGKLVEPEPGYSVAAEWRWVEGCGTSKEGTGYYPGNSTSPTALT